MNKEWDVIISVKPLNDRLYDISCLSDLSVFLLCHWPVNYGLSYTSAVCSLSQYYYNKNNSDIILKQFIKALKETGIPYEITQKNISSDTSDVSTVIS